MGCGVAMTGGATPFLAPPVAPIVADVPIPLSKLNCPVGRVLRAAAKLGRGTLGRCLLLGSLLLAGCGQSPEGACKLVWRADLPIEPRDNLIFVGVMFDDNPATMVMDTGAERTILTEAAMTRLHLRRDLRHTGNTVGIGGQSVTYEAVVDSFAVGVFRLPVESVAVGSFPLPEIAGIQADGLLGADILLAFDLDIDLPARRLTIYRARPCADSRPPWTVPYFSVEGVAMRRDRLMVPLTVNGVDGRAVLDPGAAYRDRDRVRRARRRDPGDAGRRPRQPD